MTNVNDGSLRAEIKILADQLSIVSPQGKATVFALCASGLTPLLDLVEARTGSQPQFAEAKAAIAQVEAYALGFALARDHSALRARLMGSVPHGHDLDSPWSTYAQGVLICIDAGLAASSVFDSCKPIWIQYSIEPLVTSLQYRDEDILISQGEELWGRQILGDPAMESALLFLRKIILLSERETPLLEVRYRELVSDARVLLPANP